MGWGDIDFNWAVGNQFLLIFNKAKLERKARKKEEEKQEESE